MAIPTSRFDWNSGRGTVPPTVEQTMSLRLHGSHYHGNVFSPVEYNHVFGSIS